jgi:subtilase family protein
MLLVLGLLASVPSFQQAAPSEGLRRAHPQRLLVRIDRGLDARPLTALFPELGLRELWNLPQIGWRALETRPGERDAVKRRLESDPAVLEVDYDARRELAYVPNDPLWPSQWHLSQIKANLAWDLEKGDPSVTVAIVDTGIDLTHPDLLANLWTNTGEIAGNSVDDDNNGWVDDRNGYDFAYFDSNPSDDNGHGTACAGIVAAVQDNSLGVSGIAPGCKVAAVKAALSSGYFYASANVPAYVYCADMGFQVMSMSFYSDEVVPAERDAIAYCWAQGTLPVVAAGNENSVLPFYPAGFPQSLSVGATIDATDAHAFFSNWGTWVSVAAPGWTLTTTALGGGYTGGFNGTSGATPHVAGIAALLFSANALATNADVKAAIQDACTPLNQAPYGRWIGYGRVDADAAVDRILGIVTGSVPARLLFAAPCGGEWQRIASASLPHGRHPGSVPLEVCGVGLESPNTIEVLAGTNSLPLLAQERESVRVQAPFRPTGTFQLKRNGGAVGSWTWESGPGLLYAATDGCTEDTAGSQALGGWNELYRQDGVNFTCTEDAGAQIYCEFAVRKVKVADIQRLTLEFRRDYDGMNASPIETVELYDWSSYSYPYGSWVTLSSAAAPTAGFQTLTVDVPGDPNLYRDEEGTFYLRLTTTNAGTSGQLKADMLRLRVR